jgi:hypothetical protein
MIVVADRSRGFAPGAAAVMQKPMSRQELSEALVELFLTVMLLQSAGHTVLSAPDAEAARPNPDGRPASRYGRP